MKFWMGILRTQMSWASLIVGRWTSNGGQLSKCGSLLSRRREFSHQKYVHSKNFFDFIIISAIIIIYCKKKLTIISKIH